MTGPAREWRDKLAAALMDFWCDESGDSDLVTVTAAGEVAAAYADALLPVVAGIVAGELRQAAESLRGQAVESFGWTIVVRERLNARADEIEPRESAQANTGRFEESA